MKLPKIYVSFDDFGVEWSQKRKPTKQDIETCGKFHLYAPVEKKTCVWRIQGGDHLSPHGRIALYKPLFCEDCGGKIKTRNA